MFSLLSASKTLSEQKTINIDISNERPLIKDEILERVLEDATNSDLIIIRSLYIDKNKKSEELMLSRALYMKSYFLKNGIETKKTLINHSPTISKDQLFSITFVKNNKEKLTIGENEHIKLNHMALPIRYSYFDVNLKNNHLNRLWVNKQTGLINFKLKKGSLKKNIEELIKNTNNTTNLIWKVSRNHDVFTNSVVKGKSMYHVINKILTPYRHPQQIRFGLFDGNTVAVYYDREGELL